MPCARRVRRPALPCPGGTTGSRTRRRHGWRKGCTSAGEKAEPSTSATKMPEFARGGSAGRAPAARPRPRAGWAATRPAARQGRVPAAAVRRGAGCRAGSSCSICRTTPCDSFSGSIFSNGISRSPAGLVNLYDHPRPANPVRAAGRPERRPATGRSRRLRCRRRRMMISTRRFWAAARRSRFDATGAGPRRAHGGDPPRDTPADTRTEATAWRGAARTGRLYSADPVLSVCPSTVTRVSG